MLEHFTNAKATLLFMRNAISNKHHSNICISPEGNSSFPPSYKLITNSVHFQNINKLQQM
jgi:hypothetical protein